MKALRILLYRKLVVRALTYILGVNLLLMGCAGNSPEELGSATLAISQVPEDVQCVRVTATLGGLTGEHLFSVAGGHPAFLRLSRLSPGTTLFVAEAFAEACDAVTSLTVPTWLSEPVTATVTVASRLTLALVLTPNGRANLCLDFRAGDASGITLSSLTLDPETATGATTGGPEAWSTGATDAFPQLLVALHGRYLNQGAEHGSLGELSVPLAFGASDIMLAGNALQPHPSHYGAVLFFDGQAVSPQVAVYSRNGSTGAFEVQPAGTPITTSATGGPVSGVASGRPWYEAPNRVRVEVQSFTLDAIGAGPDLILWNKLGSMEDIAHSQVGPGFTATPGVQLVSGWFGGALATTGGETGGGGYLSMSPDSFFGQDRRQGTVDVWIQKRIAQLLPFTTPLVGIFGLQLYDHQGGECSYGAISAFWSDGYTGSGGLSFFIQDPGNTAHEAADLAWNAVPVGTWSHVAFVWYLDGIDGSADKLRIYRDGVLVASNSDAIPGLRATECPVKILGHHAYSRLGQPVAYLDNLRVWAGAKTQITAQFRDEAPLPASPVDLVSPAHIFPDGQPDTIARLRLNVTPRCP